MRIILIILITLLFFPFLCKSSIGLSPAKIGFDEKQFKAGESYFLKPNIQISNTDPEERNMVISVECFESKLCPEKDWFTFIPETFTLAPNSAREVIVQMKVPRDISPKMYGKYDFVVQASLAPNQPNSSGEKTMGTLGFALGVRIEDFKLSGKIAWHKATLYWLQDKIGNKMLASIESVGLEPKSIGVVLLIFIGGYSLIFVIKKIISKFLPKRD